MASPLPQTGTTAANRSGAAAASFQPAAPAHAVPRNENSVRINRKFPADVIQELQETVGLPVGAHGALR